MLRCADASAGGLRARPAGRPATLVATLTALATSLAMSLAMASPAVAAEAGSAPTPGSIIQRGNEAGRDTNGLPTLDESEAVQAAEAAVGRTVPDIVMHDRLRRSVTLSDYRGKPLLVSFIYTGCFQICPTQTRALLEAVNGLDRMLGSHQFNVVSIGFNQPFDSPAAMRAFAAEQRIDHPNWEFLSPPREAVAALTRAFGFSWVETPAGFDHLLGVTVVDANGRISAQVYGDRLRADQLGNPLRRLLLDAPPPPEASLFATMVERVRILCTVYDESLGAYRYDYKLIFEIVGGLLFFMTVAVYFLLEWRNQRRARGQTCSHPRVSGNSA